MKMRIVCLVLVPHLALAKIKVVATTTDLGDLARQIGQNYLELSVITKGGQDPHYVETKPSYLVRLRDADLVIVNGLALESAWLPSLLRGARNPAIVAGARGYLDLGSLIEPIEVRVGRVTRADGDVHPEGNPHFTLDPVKAVKAAEFIRQKLGELDPAHSGEFENSLRSFKSEMEKKTQDWQRRLAHFKTPVVTYHPTLNYFLQRFEIPVAGYLEPKPGIPPTAKQIMDLKAKAREQKVRRVLVDSYFDTKIAERLAEGLKDVKVKSVGVAVEARPELRSLVDVIEQVVAAIEAP